MPAPIVIAVAEVSQVGEVRRAVLTLAGRLGFDEAAAGRAALVVTEAANNLVKHAHEGVMVLRPRESIPHPEIEVLALDKGPGMADVGRCLRDGFSTAGTPGNGLGAIVRLSTFTDFYSRIPTGTALLIRLGAGMPPAPAWSRRFQAEAVSVPKTGEEVCGDAWAVFQQGNRALMMIADGLGHGPVAAEAAQAAVRIFEQNTRLGPADILQTIHPGLRSTRGAAIAIGEIDLDREVVRFSGVGNITGYILTGGNSQSMVSHNGTVGHQASKFQDFTYPFPKDALLVMHSDGLISHWKLDAYPGLVLCDPALVAGVLYRDFQRGRDDVTVLVARAAKGAVA